MIKEQNFLNPLEAPDGFVAIKREDITDRWGERVHHNICSFCDWRSECQKPDTNFHNSNHRCMANESLSSTTGETLKREDGCNVVFKAHTAN